MNSGTDETLLEMAREWVREQDPAFHRFFDISTEDTAWLKQLLTVAFTGSASCPLPPFESFYFIVRTVTRSGTF